MKHQKNNKKKYIASAKDKKDWLEFTKEMNNVTAKENDFLEINSNISRVKKLDLHGFSLTDANKEVKKFILKSFTDGFKKLLIVTGKGTRSNSYVNPYISENFSILKNSVPEYIKKEESLYSKIINISPASLKDGGEGAIYIFLKKNNKSKV